MLSKGLVAALGIVVISAFFGLFSSFATRLDHVPQKPSFVEASHSLQGDTLARAFLPIIPVEAASAAPPWSPLTGDGSN